MIRTSCENINSVCLLLPYVLFSNIEHKARAIVQYQWLCCWFWVCIYLLEKYLQTEKLQKLNSWRKAFNEGFHKMRLHPELLVWLEIGHTRRARLEYQCFCYMHSLVGKISKLQKYKNYISGKSHLMKALT